MEPSEVLDEGEQRFQQIDTILAKYQAQIIQENTVNITNQQDLKHVLAIINVFYNTLKEFLNKCTDENCKDLHVSIEENTPVSSTLKEMLNELSPLMIWHPKLHTLLSDSIDKRFSQFPFSVNSTHRSNKIPE